MRQPFRSHPAEAPHGVSPGSNPVSCAYPSRPGIRRRRSTIDSASRGASPVQEPVRCPTPRMGRHAIAIRTRQNHSHPPETLSSSHGDPRAPINCRISALRRTTAPGTALAYRQPAASTPRPPHLLRCRLPDGTPTRFATSPSRRWIRWSPMILSLSRRSRGCRWGQPSGHLARPDTRLGAPGH